MLRRAPAIWTSEQAVDLAGVVAAFHGHARRDGENRYYLARLKFRLPVAPTAARLRLTTDGKYQLWVNGTRIGRGPVRCDPLFQRYDSYDFVSRLRAGGNVIGVVIRVEGRDTAQYQSPRCLWQEIFGDGALWIEGEVSCGGETICVDGSPAWRFLRCEAWRQNTPIGNASRGYLEEFYAERFPAGWLHSDFDDSHFSSARPLVAGGGGPEGMFGGMGIEPFPTLLPRIAPRPTERTLPTDKLTWAAIGGGAETLEFDQQIYRQTLSPAPAGTVELDDAATGTLRVKTSGSGRSVLQFEFDALHAGFAFLEVEAQGGEVIDIAVGERLSGDVHRAEGASTLARLAPEPSYHGSDANVARYHCRPGRQRFEKFSWDSVRWLELSIGDTRERGLVTITGVGAVATGQALELQGALETNNEAVQKLWRLGERTLRLCMQDTWIDCPGREQRQWLGDVAVEFAAAWAVFGTAAAPLTRQFLYQAAESQRADGLTQMFAPGDHGHDFLLIPDWTLHWILTLDDYVMRTGDVDVAEDLLPAAERAVAWFDAQCGASGMLENVPHWLFVDWAGVGRHGISTIINALLVGACRALSRLRQAVGDGGSAARFTARAAALTEKLNALAWDDGRGVYVDVVTPRDLTREARVSQHANALMILFDIAPGERWPSMLAWCCDPARLKLTKAPRVVPRGEALNDGTDCVAANTFFSHFVVAAWAKAGALAAGLRETLRRFAPMLATDTTTLWENYTPSASLCHGFSASLMHQFSAELFGLAPLARGYARVRLRPQLAGLNSTFKVRYPTPMGAIELRYAPEDGGALITCELPAAMQLEVQTPPGHVVEAVIAGRQYRVTAATDSAVY